MKTVVPTFTELNSQSASGIYIRMPPFAPEGGPEALSDPMEGRTGDNLAQRPVRGLAEVYEAVAGELLVDPADAAELPGALVVPIVMVAPESRAEVGRGVLEALL